MSFFPYFLTDCFLLQSAANGLAPDWFTRHEAWAVWLEGLALVLLLAAEMYNAHKDRQEAIKQLKLAQDQIKLSQNAERAWVLTDLVWPDPNELKVVTGASRSKDEPQVETTQVAVNLICRNEGRSPAWIDKIQGYAELVEGRLKDLSSPVGHEAKAFLPLGPIAPGGKKDRGLILTAPGQVRKDQIISLFVLVEYRDPFGEKRVTTCGYTVSSGVTIGPHLDRQEQFPERNITLSFKYAGKNRLSG